MQNKAILRNDLTPAKTAIIKKSDNKFWRSLKKNPSLLEELYVNTAVELSVELELLYDTAISLRHIDNERTSYPTVEICAPPCLLLLGPLKQENETNLVVYQKING